MANIVFRREMYFYSAFNNDAHIINDLFGYKLYKQKDIDKASFPINIAGWVKYILEMHGFSTTFLDKNDNELLVVPLNEKPKSKVAASKPIKASLENLYKLGPWRSYMVAFDNNGELVTDLELVLELRKFRNLKALEYNETTSHIFNNKVLVYLATVKPRTIDELQIIKDFKKKSIETFGEELIAFIDNYRYEI